VDLPSGYYNIYLQTWDAHNPCDTSYHAKQLSERAYLSFRYDDGAGLVEFSSTSSNPYHILDDPSRLSDEIEQDECGRVTQVGTNVHFPVGLASTTPIRFVHMLQNSNNTCGPGTSSHGPNADYVTQVIPANGGTQAELSSTGGLCSDGIDNDGDLLTDMNDPGCWEKQPSKPNGDDWSSFIPVCAVFERVGGGGGAVEILEF
jgi:hypothetical protein